MRSKPVLCVADARRMMGTARAEAERQHLEVSIVIVDDAGVPLLLERLDGARLHTPEAAMLKARTASITRTPTASLQDQVRIEPAMLSFPGPMPVSCGMSIVHEGQVVGGIASSGAAPEQDEAVCLAELAALPEAIIAGEL